MTISLVRRAVLAAGMIAALGIAGCDGGGGGGGDSAAPPGSPDSSTESNFGTTFATLFRAGANTDPANTVAGDAGSLSPTTDPVAF